MTCKHCIHFSECESLAMSSFDHSHKMWMIDFWGNAHERCEWFKETDDKKSEWCVSCGAEIPEGRMVCPICEKKGERLRYE